jgi:hypothetical protein
MFDAQQSMKEIFDGWQPLSPLIQHRFGSTATRPEGNGKLIHLILVEPTLVG